MAGLSRRSFLAGAGALGIVAACGGDDDGGDDADPATSTSTTVPSLVLGPAFDPNALLVPGVEQRAPFVLFQASGGLVPFADAPDELAFRIAPESGPAAAPVTVAKHGEDVDRAYYPLRTTFPAGVSSVLVEVDGVELSTPVGADEANGVPQLGQPLRPVRTPTVADPLGVQTLCTAEPACPLHAVSVDTALGSGSPVAVLVSTPAYCQVAICGPVLDLLLAAAPAHPGLTAIHYEVYPNGDPSQPDALAPDVVEFIGANYEPVLFVTDGSGVVTARLDNIYDGAELDAALRTAAP
jgi:hypothetical protein